MTTSPITTLIQQFLTAFSILALSLGFAHAAPITYVVDVDFANGDELFGVFDYDASTGATANIDLILTDGSGSTKNTFTVLLGDGAPEGPSSFFFADAPVTTPFVSQAVSIELDNPLTDLGGTFDVLPGSFDPVFVSSFVATCAPSSSSLGCGGFIGGSEVFITSGTVTGLPDTSEIPLPAAAPLFAAGMVLLARRRFRSV